jgi:hypothetical protein
MFELVFMEPGTYKEPSIISGTDTVIRSKLILEKQRAIIVNVIPSAHTQELLSFLNASSNRAW